MKHKSLFLSGLILVTLSAVAQSTGFLDPKDVPTSIAAARCQYAQTDEACVNAGPTLAQIPRPIPGPPMHPPRPPMRYPRGGYPGPWFEPNGRHAAIGALIGFTVGAIHPNDGTVRGHMALGLIGGLLGAAIGAGSPSFHARNHYRHGPWPDEEDEVASGSKSAKPDSAPAIAREADAPKNASP